MARERFDAVTARIPARITSALAVAKEASNRRRIAHEQGRVDLERIPQDQEITLMVQPNFRECADTRSFDVTQSQVVGYLTPEARLRRQLSEAYAPFITHKEDPRLKSD